MITIEPSYHDYFGREVIVPQSTIDALSQAVGEIPDESRIVDTVHVVRNDEHPVRVPVRSELGGEPLDWTLTLEDGTPLAGRSPVEDGAIAVADDLPLGYHRLCVREACLTLIVVPVQAWLPLQLEHGVLWGFSLQLYSLRSPGDWGIGDFGSLRAFARSAGATGAQAFGLNPLHAPNVADPLACSPYDPASRLWLNPWYIDVEAVEEFAASPTPRPPRGGSLVDYDAVATAKLAALERCHRSFHALHRGDERARAFSRFVAEGGESLRTFALFCAIAEHLRDAAGIVGGWSGWPLPYRDPNGDAVRIFERDHAERVEFHQYLQWLADEQLGRAAAACGDGAIGLYRDLAVGTSADGADSWGAREAFVPGVSVGAPPDAVNTLGQNWGLTPFHPANLRREAYAPFVALLRANMRHAGALRIDHVMAMQRLFWIPHGRPASEGAYVRYPLDDLLGITALESVRSRCAVVGEDLGTVPEGFRERLNERRIFGCRLLFFERDAQGRFCAPQTYPPAALVSTGTHDLPSLPSWWQGSDLDLRERLGFLSPEAAAEGRAERERARALLVEALRASGDLTEPFGIDALVEAAYCFLARSPSRFLIVQLEDILLQTDAVNVPGTFGEHPNWQRRLPVDAQQIVETPLARRLTDALQTLRPAERERNQSES